VITQENQGRFMARKTGIEAARGDLVLLLDSRTSLDPDALAFVAPEIAAGRRVWNGHPRIDTAAGPFARFWDTLTYAAFADYLADPRTTSFGEEEYDRFPKGTTHFLCPREYLLEAIEGFESFYDDPRNANDDTTLLRSVVARERINISPQFGSVYQSRTALGPFLRHALHRGVVFFDGFGRPGARFFPVIVAAFPAALGGVLLALVRPRVAFAAVAAAPLAAGALAARWKRPWKHVASFALLTPPFAVVYTLGIWKGALLAGKARWAR
jgi:glycosyltransferase involved in cell wall biosynthesis